MKMADPVALTPAPDAAHKAQRFRLGPLLLKARTFIALILVVAFFGAMAPNFMAVDNVVIISRHVAINAFLAIGMTYVIVTGGIAVVFATSDLKEALSAADRIIVMSQGKVTGDMQRDDATEERLVAASTRAIAPPAGAAAARAALES